jgi:predicted DNA-binding transcriptional regulator AlpA
LSRDLRRQDIVGVSEVAEYLGISRQRLSNWVMRRYHNFPEPIAKLACGSIFNLEDIQDWMLDNENWNKEWTL